MKELSLFNHLLRWYKAEGKTETKINCPITPWNSTQPHGSVQTWAVTLLEELWRKDSGSLWTIMDGREDGRGSEEGGLGMEMYLILSQSGEKCLRCLPFPTYWGVNRGAWELLLPKASDRVFRMKTPRARNANTLRGWGDGEGRVGLTPWL